MGRLSEHFVKGEFLCSCGCNEDFEVVRSLINVLEDIRNAIDEPIRVTSGARCKKKNLITPGAASSSWHIPRGKKLYASDITYSNEQKINKLNILRLYVLADDYGSMGLGLYNGRIHVDQRTGHRARWVHRDYSWN